MIIYRENVTVPGYGIVFLGTPGTTLAIISTRAHQPKPGVATVNEDVQAFCAICPKKELLISTVGVAAGKCVNI